MASYFEEYQGHHPKSFERISSPEKICVLALFIDRGSRLCTMREISQILEGGICSEIPT